MSMSQRIIGPANLTAISLGAGLQSSVLVEMVAEGELPRPDLVIFADTQDEPQYVYDQVKHLHQRLSAKGIRLEIVTKGDMIKDIYAGGRFAAMPLFTRNAEGEKAQLKRQCTSEYKIAPIERQIKVELLRRNLAKQVTKNYDTGARIDTYVKKGVIVEQWLGITADEAERMATSRHFWQRLRYPLVERRMTRQDCADWLTARGLPVPQKSSCRHCPYHDNQYWLDMRLNRPEDWKKVAKFDNDLRNGELRIAATARNPIYLHRTLIPLSELPLQMPLEIEANPGHCGPYCEV